MKKYLLLPDFRSLIDIRDDEAALVGVVLLYTVCATMTDILVSTVAYALFLSKFDAQRLPFIYVGVSVGSVLISTFYLQLSQRYSLAQLLYGKHLLIWLTLIGIRTSLAVSGAQWLIFSLPIWHGVINVLFYIAFWNLVGRLFNLQQGKRLFGLFGIGQQLAGLLVGLLIPSLVSWAGATNLLWVAACSGGAAVLFLSAIVRRADSLHSQESDRTEAEEENQTPTTPLLRDRYIQLIFLMFVLFTLGSYFVDNIFYNRLESYYPNENQLASFLGLFNGLIGGLSLLSQLFITNRLLSRYGVRTVVILTPLLLLLPTLLFAALGGAWGLVPALFWLAVAMNLAVQVMNDTDNTAANLLYQPLAAGLRTRAQTIVDGIVSPIAVGVTGVILLILTNLWHFDALQLSYVLIPLLVGWTIASRLVGQGYGKRVQQALRQRTIQGKQGFQPDRASLELIQQTLTSPHPGAVIYALDVLDSTNQAALTHYLPHLLTHPSIDVRLEALTRLERLGENSVLPAIYHCWQQDRERSVRSAALQAMATLGGGEYADSLYDYLVVPDVEMRRSVMIGFLRSGELEAILAAGEQLTHLVDSPLPTERMLAAQILGESGITGFYRPLLTLLHDPQPQVQRTALHAAGKLQHPKLWLPIIDALALPQSRAAARTALLANGEALLPTLSTLLAQTLSTDSYHPQPALAMHNELVRICGRLCARSTNPLQRGKTIEILLGNLASPDLQVRIRALQALSLCGYRADTNSRPFIEEQIQAEIAFAAWTVAGLSDLGNCEQVALVRDALVESLRQQRMRFYWWFTLLYESATLSRVRDAFGAIQGFQRQPSAEQRAYLSEAIDLLIAKSYSKVILPLLDELTPAQQMAKLAADFPQPALSSQQRLLAILSCETSWISSWLHAVALYCADALDLGDEERQAVQEAAHMLTNASDELLRQTARWVVRRSATEKAIHCTNQEDETMLLTIEKVIILRTVDIFANTPDEVLAEVAGLLKESETPAGATIFDKGDQGESMYIIVEGEVEALDGDHVFTKMGERQVFGEMALLDGEPRTATIRTTQPTRLLRLDQEPFYELLEDQPEITRGIIHVLLQRLRARTNDVNRLQAQLQSMAQ